MISMSNKGTHCPLELSHAYVDGRSMEVAKKIREIIFNALRDGGVSQIPEAMLTKKLSQYAKEYVRTKSILDGIVRECAEHKNNAGKTNITIDAILHSFQKNGRTRQYAVLLKKIMAYNKAEKECWATS